MMKTDYNLNTERAVKWYDNNNHNNKYINWIITFGGGLERSGKRHAYGRI
jgi:hypothetical protein